MKTVKKLKETLVPKEIKSFDIFIFIFILLLCFVLFQQGDLFHTTLSSYAYLQGHFLDFYDYNKNIVGRNDYFPSIYIIFAIWNIPLKLLGLIPSTGVPNAPIYLNEIQLLWSKILLILFYLYTAYYIYLISKLITKDSVKSKFVSIVFLTSPIAIFAIFIFGQYDIIGLFFSIVGIYYFLKKDYIKFTIFFSISISLKFFPLIIFIPLLLLVKKKVFEIIKYLILASSVTILEFLIYFRSEIFRAEIFGLASDKISAMQNFNISPLINAPYLIILLCILCIYCYIKYVESDENLYKQTVFVSLTAYSIMFATVVWHPQWLILITPFFALSYIYIENKVKALIFDIVGMFAFIYITVDTWVNGVDQAMAYQGILREFITYTPLTMNYIFKAKYLNYVGAIFLVYLFTPLLIILFENKRTNVINCDENIFLNNIKGIRSRLLLGMSIFLIPAFICLFAPKYIVEKINPDAYMYKGYENIEATTPVGEITRENEVLQSFTSEYNGLRKINIRFATYNRINDCTINLKLLDYKNNLIFEENIEGKNLLDNTDYPFRFPIIEKSKNQKYFILVTSEDATLSNAVTIWMSEKNKIEGDLYLNNELMTNNELCIGLFYDTLVKD